MQNGPALAVDESSVQTPAARGGVHSAAVSRAFRVKRALRAILAAVTRYDSWVWRLALLVGVVAYGLAMAIAMSAHPHI
jgi:hypothetical protein